MAAMDIPKTAGERWDANIRALRILRELNEDGREPSEEERAALRRYSGWGDSAFNDAFPPAGEEYRISERGEQLQRIVPDADWKAIRTSRLNAHYTTPEIINSMRDVVDDAGIAELENPVVLEPSAGSGRFIGLQPAELRDRAQWHAVELDTTTGQILAHAYPAVAVQIRGFENAAIPNNSVDLAISNVPFGRYGVGSDPTFIGSGVDEGRKVAARRIHNYFFVKSLDKLKPGGILAFVTTAGTMNAPTSEPFRRYMAERADLIDAIRLPSDAFPDTSVVTDVIFLRKRDPDDDSPRNLDWVETERMTLPFEGGEASVPVNSYFIKHPEKALGTPHAEGNMYGDEPGYGLNKNPEFKDQLKKAVQRASRAAAAASVPAYRERHDNIRAEQRAAESERRQDAGFRAAPGDYFIDSKGRLMEFEQRYEMELFDTIDQKGKAKQVKQYFAVGEPRAVEVKDKDRAARVRGMLSIRDRAATLMDEELNPEADPDAVEEQRAALNAEYRAFREKYGPLNSKANIKAMRRDGSQTFIRSLEICEAAEGCAPAKRGQRADLTDNWQPVDIFQRRVHRVAPEARVETAADALVAVRDLDGNRGRIDFEMMGEMLGQSPAEVQQRLESEGLIFRNPQTGHWEGREEYLSGDVRQKLEDAEELLYSGYQQYEPYVAALREVQPEDIPAGDIYVTPGAAWVTHDLVNQFVAEEILQNREEYTHDSSGRYSFRRNMDKPYEFFVKDEGSGRWRAGWSLNKASNVPPDLRDEWSTPEKGVGDIIQAALEGGIIKVTKEVVDEHGKKHRVPDHDATLAAQQKVNAVVERFRDWLWRSPLRASQSAARYNRYMNNIRPRTFDGSHLTFPGMDGEWAAKLRPHQKDAVYRVMRDGTAMLAHEVGFGKTAVLVAGALERKRLGLSNKPMFVVPKATHKQFLEQAQELYPNARFLFPQDGDFTPENREAFLYRVRTGDWDGIIVSGEQFSSIPLTAQTEAAWLEQEVDRLRKSLYARNQADAAGKKKPSRRQKEEESRLQEAIARLQALQTERQQLNDANTERFEKLGVDAVLVDEADRYKNLAYSTAIDDVKGLPNADSLRSRDMYIKTQWLQGRIPGSYGHQGKSEKSDSGFKREAVVFATGTPIANTVAEAWTMMRYLQGDDLKKRNMENFDEFANTYGLIETGAEATPQGTYKIVNRFKRFSNVPELSRLLQEAWDIRVAREVPEMRERQPDVRHHRVQAPTYPDLQTFQKSLEKRVESLGVVDPKDDNMLKISSDARKASMDIRMVSWEDEYGRPATPEPNPQGKIPKAAVNVAEIYRAETPDKGVQLVFLDLGTPKASTAKNDDELDQQEGKGDELTGAEQETLKDLYRVMKRRMVAEGVPEQQVAFIHDYPKDDQRQELFAKVRRGDVRVLVGSTDKLGVGVNVQNRATALHHLDAPWRPRDIEQREGRVIRQGNVVYGPVFEDGIMVSPGRGVDIYTYVQAGSFDEFMWQGLEAKSQSIAQLMTRNPTVRTIEDAGEFTASAAEIRALASGNPRIIEVENMKRKVGNLRGLKRNYHSQLATAAQDADGLEDRVTRQEARLPKVQEDAARARQVIAAREASPQSTEMTVGDTSYSKATDGNKALGTALESLPLSADWRQLGTWYGWNVEGLKNDAGGFHIALVSPDTGLDYSSTAMTDTAGVGNRLRSLLNKVTEEEQLLPQRLLENQNMLARYQKMREGWEQEEELRRLERQYQCLRYEVYGEGDCPPDDGDGAFRTADLDIGIDHDQYASLRADLDAPVDEYLREQGYHVAEPALPTETLSDEVLAQDPAVPPLDETRRGVSDTEDGVWRDRHSGKRGHNLMPQELADTIPPLGAYENTKPDDVQVSAKLFSPYNNWTWYITEYDPTTGTAFGLTDGWEKEIGYFDLNELAETTVHGGVPAVERDLHWDPKTLAEVRGDARTPAPPEDVPEPSETLTGPSTEPPPPVVEPLTTVIDDEPPEIRLWIGRALTQGATPVVLTQRAAEPGDEAQFSLSGQDLYQDLGDVYTSVVPLNLVTPTDNKPLMARNSDVVLLDKSPVLVAPGVIPAGAPMMFPTGERVNYGYVQGGPQERRTFRIEKPRRSTRARAGRIASAR